MALTTEMKSIRDAIWQYKDIANSEEKRELKKILKHELNLLNKNM